MSIPITIPLYQFRLTILSYQFRTEEFAHLNLLEGKQYGFIAQELEQVLPNLVTNSDLDQSQVNVQICPKTEQLAISEVISSTDLIVGTKT